MWTAILSLFTGQIPGIVREIMQARVDLAKSTTEKERVLAEERIHTLEARRDFLISNNRWAMYMIAAILFPFILYLNWIILHDKIICHWYVPGDQWANVCSTDALGNWEYGIFGAILTLLTLKKV